MECARADWCCGRDRAADACAGTLFAPDAPYPADCGRAAGAGTCRLFPAGCLAGLCGDLRRDGGRRLPGRSVGIGSAGGDRADAAGLGRLPAGARAALRRVLPAGAVCQRRRAGDADYHEPDGDVHRAGDALARAVCVVGAVADGGAFGGVRAEVFSAGRVRVGVPAVRNCAAIWRAGHSGHSDNRALHRGEHRQARC
jgi:hypothetical protein